MRADHGRRSAQSLRCDSSRSLNTRNASLRPLGGGLGGGGAARFLYLCEPAGNPSLLLCERAREWNRQRHNQMEDTMMRAVLLSLAGLATAVFMAVGAGLGCGIRHRGRSQGHARSRHCRGQGRQGRRSGEVQRPQGRVPGSRPLRLLRQRRRRRANAHPKLIGTDLRTIKDKTGKPFGQEMFDTASEGKISEVSYMWPRPDGTEPVRRCPTSPSSATRSAASATTNRANGWWGRRPSGPRLVSLALRVAGGEKRCGYRSYSLTSTRFPSGSRK